MKDNAWVLFGLDLAPYLAKSRLAIEQILWGEEAGLYRYLSDAARLHSSVQDGDTPSLIDVFGEQVRGSEEAHAINHDALLLNHDAVLYREISLPTSYEVQSGEAVELEVQNASPFPADRTRYGSRIVSRSGEQVTIAIVITSSEEVEQLFSGHQEVAPTAEIWCDGGERLVRINDGLVRGRREAHYLQRLQMLAYRIAALAVACFACLLIPAWTANIRADQLGLQLEEARATSKDASALREALDQSADKLTVAAEQLEQREFYASWLHALAELTPDSAYLSRLDFTDDTLQIGGYAENAADLQSRLVSSALFSDVTATTAFRRNARMSLEQFNFELTLGTLPSLARADAE